MMRAAFIILALSFPGRETSSAELPDPPYIILESPLSSRQLDYLSKNRFRIEKDGTVWGPTAKIPTSKSEMPYLLQRLEGAERLRVLFDLNSRLSRSNDGKNMSPEEKVELRKILRENWHLFSFSTRKDFKKYFTLEEIAELGYEPAAPALPLPPLRANEFEDDSRDSPAPAAPAAFTPKLPAVLLPLGLSQSPPAPPVESAETPPAETVPAPKSAPPSEPPPSPPAVVPVLQPTIPIAVLPPAPPEPQIPLPAAINPPVLPESQPPAAAETKTSIPSHPFSLESFNQFLPDAPYGREVKSLLSLIARSAPEKERKLALQTVISTLASIVIDNSRMGLDLRGTASHNPPAPPQIILSPGPLIYSQRKLFFEGPESVLPVSPEALSLLGLPATLQAANRNEIPLKIEKSEWGETQIFKDGSRRGTYSPEQQAGTLLFELTLLNRRLAGEDASSWQSQLFARNAQWMFYSKLEEESGNDSFLDPMLKAAYREWSQARWDSLDFAAHIIPGGSPQERAFTAAPTGSDNAPYTPPSRSFSVEIPSGWLALEENEPTGTVSHILAPADARTSFRAGLDIHWVDSHAGGHIPLKQAIELLRRKDPATHRSPGGLKRLSVDSGLARYFEVTESRHVPPERAPSRRIEIHHYLAVIPRGESYFLVRLASDRDSYLDYRDLFLKAVKSVKSAQ